MQKRQEEARSHLLDKLVCMDGRTMRDLTNGKMLLQAERDRRLWRAMIAHVLKTHRRKRSIYASNLETRCLTKQPN